MTRFFEDDLAVLAVTEICEEAGFRVQGLGFRVRVVSRCSCGFRVQDLALSIHSGCRSPWVTGSGVVMSRVTSTPKNFFFGRPMSLQVQTVGIIIPICLN